jgi:ABC-type glycerol-3-phosphate transport system permease component
MAAIGMPPIATPPVDAPPVDAPPSRRRAPRPASQPAPVLWVVLSVLAVVVLVPLMVLVVGTFAPSNRTWWPLSFTLEQYRTAPERVDMLRYARNSLVLGAVYTVPVVVSSLGAGYAFARLRTRYSQVLFSIVGATMLVPVFVYLIPLFIVYSRLGLTNTVVPWLLWGLAGNPFYIFLFRQFFDSFPRELEEAAELDGLSRFGILWRIVVPNSYSIIATVTILAFTNVWGEILLQSVLLNRDSAATLSVRLASGVLDVTGNAVLVGPTLAAMLLYILPPVVVFVVFQRFILRGVATSGLK